jgi:hypothetical protein
LLLWEESKTIRYFVHGARRVLRAWTNLLTQTPTDGKLHIVPRVQFSFSDANTVLSESAEGTVSVIADSVGSGFLPTVT